MRNPAIINEFEKLVKNKFNVYNSLFLSLPYKKIENTGMLIPLLTSECTRLMETGASPSEILDEFFTNHARITTEQEKIDFMFMVIQYVERQVVLYDSVEDAAFTKLKNQDDYISLKEHIHLVEEKDEVQRLLNILSTFSTRLVLTAHPTQFYPPAVLDIISKLRELINKNDINKIDLILQQLALTSLLNPQKPTPFDEARNIIYFLKNVYYDAVNTLYTGIKANFKEGQFDNPAILQIGFWAGGDRDGNPFVTYETTKNVADKLRMTLMKCYFRDVDDLAQKLTFRNIVIPLKELKSSLYASMFDQSAALSFTEIMEPLRTIKSILINQYNSLYLDDLQALINKVKIFRTHFAILDIRQNHTAHVQCIEEILKKEKLITNNLDELTQDELIKILIKKDFKVNANDYENDIVVDTIRNIAQLKSIQDKNGVEGCSRYIISNSEDVFSVLMVYGLLRWCWQDGPEFLMDIVPLFESMEGMENAVPIMKALFEIPEYRAHLKNRNDTQTVMLGFSDGTKDGGYLQANWSILRAKEQLSALCDQYGIKCFFFDGRGGPPARGGGKTHKFYASQTQRIANHGIQLTIQGQTITSEYSSKGHFIHNCEQLLTAGLCNNNSQMKNDISNESRELIEQLAELSYQKYNDLKNHPLFVPYLESKSTLKYYSEANIGSRPAKRGNKKILELKDLRAIPFVGSWSQLKQNIPGYYGIGTAIKTLVEDGKLEDLKRLAQEVPFFKALMQNSMMSLKKCNFSLTSHITRDDKFREFYKLLVNEYELSNEMVLQILDCDYLMQHEPLSRRSVEIREQIILPLLVIQQYALQMIEQDADNKNVYEKLVSRSLYGSINASRNSA